MRHAVRSCASRRVIIMIVLCIIDDGATVGCLISVRLFCHSEYCMLFLLVVLELYVFFLCVFARARVVPGCGVADGARGGRPAAPID